MPIHNWSRVEPGVFHDFHQTWSVELLHALNSGELPTGYFALIERSSQQVAENSFLDWPARRDRTAAGHGIALAEIPPRSRFTTSAHLDEYARMANRIVIRHPAGEVVSVIDIASPGNKYSRQALRLFVRKSENLLRRGIHLLVVDLFPPTPRDPQGIHKAIWDEFLDESFELPSDKPLTVASYFAGPPPTAYVEPVGVGDDLPDAMPIFLSSGEYVHAPLETTYQTTWAKCPEPVRELIE